MICPKCSCTFSKLHRTVRDDKDSLIHERLCKNSACKHRWYTLEVIPPAGAVRKAGSSLERNEQHRRVRFSAMDEYVSTSNRWRRTDPIAQ